MARPETTPATPLSGAELAEWLDQVVQWHTPADQPVEPFDDEPPSIVPRTATPLRGFELAQAFDDGHVAATGRHVDKRLGENALAIIGVENANGRAIIQHNWGNVSCTPRTWSGPMWQTPTPQSGQPLYFRAYSSHLEGCSAWWRLMYRGGHVRALEFAARGRPDLMVDALYASHYVVGGSQSGYRRNAVLFARQYRRAGLFGSFPFMLNSGSDLVGAGAFVAGAAIVTGLRVRNWWRNQHA
jgi:hypothetical protein